ncbi:uncharacterized protein isoform X2 [Rhodnius prolixus]|uniref:uncharacterized protein isoform X2 n=1 Tax=Rhodnius prolixus TaxID=13249 RepID=UPI003D18C46D
MTDVDHLPQKCYCRLCAKYELCTDIFSANGMRQLLSLKINSCLPIQSKLEEETNRLLKGNGHEEVTSSVTKPLSPSAAESTGPVVVLPLTIDNVAQFNRISAGGGSVMEKETSPPVPVISSVLTLASGPPITKPIKLNPGNNISDDEERPKKKERKTVCSYCKQWFPRSKIQEHEKSHMNEINFSKKT